MSVHRSSASSRSTCSGPTLRAIVGLSVGIIVFEDAFHLSIERARNDGFRVVQRDATDATVLQNARAEDADSLTVESPSSDLPTGCLVVMVSRDGEDSVPDPDTRLRHGDHLTLVCQENEAMRDAVERCRSGN